MGGERLEYFMGEIQAHDVDPFLELYNLCYTEDIWKHSKKKILKEMEQDIWLMGMYRSYVNGDNELVGFVAYDVVEEPFTQIYSLGIHPAYRREGLGTVLLSMFSEDRIKIQTPDEYFESCLFLEHNGYKYEGRKDDKMGRKIRCFSRNFD